MAKQSVGIELLQDPKANKATAFTAAERSAKKLEGLLPAVIEDMETQVGRVLGHLSAKPDDLERYVYLQELADRNETLYYAVLMRDPARFVPIVYDPTIADACLTYGHIFRRPQGMYLTKEMKGRFAEVLANWPTREIRFICISSGGRILGLGDIGANGAPIPIGKLQLYTACAGVPPEALLPIHFDIGTTNAALREDSLYTGLRSEPPPPDEVDALVDEFMEAANKVFPGVCVHFEDWKGTDAIRLLARYKDDYLVYNDDIQGTASVTIAGLTTALQIKNEKLADQKILFAGAGSAGIGIANMIVEAMVAEGLSGDDARDRIAMFDISGLLDAGRNGLSPSQKVYAKNLRATTDLTECVKSFNATVLIGVSTTQGLFTEAVVKAVAANTDRPIVFPLSNPTNKAECTAQQAFRWTNGKVLFAAGVQFPDVVLNGKAFHPGQANNFYIFPAMGLAVYATRPKSIDDRMWIAAAEGSAGQVDQAARDRGMLFPGQADILDTEITTAARIAEHIFDRGLTTVSRPRDVRAWIRGLTYTPQYTAEPPQRNRPLYELEEAEMTSAQKAGGVPVMKDVPIGIGATGGRKEFDSMGTVVVPADRYWGAQTQRSLQHFSIGDDRMPKPLYHVYGYVKKAAALVNAKGGRLEQWRAEAIIKAADEVIAGALDAHFPLYVWQTGSGTQSNMNVNEVIANRAIQLLGGALGEQDPIHPNEHVNLGQSSNDSFPTAMHIATVLAIDDEMLPSLDRFATAIEAKANDWMDVVKTGRTHLQDAVPLTVGQEWSGYAAQVRDAMEVVRCSLNGLYRLACGGTAVGTGLNAPEGFSVDIAKSIADLTGKAFVTAPNKFAAQGSLDAMVATIAGVKGLAVALMKIANDMRWLASGPRCGLGELLLPQNEPGSSIMPGKVNPTQCEAMMMVCIQVIGEENAVTLAGGQGNFELNAMRPIIINNALHSIRIIGDMCDRMRTYSIEGAQLNRGRIDASVGQSLMLVTALSPVVGYDNAAHIAELANADGSTLKEAALKSGKVDEKTFDDMVDPRKLAGKGVQGA